MAAQVESWDDDVDFQGDLFAHSVSTAPTTFSSASFSSRQSIRSESNAGDEDWQVLLSPNDESSTLHAISSAKQAGIPIPTNVPSSALLGGSIKRLGKQTPRQKVHDDWGEDLELPDAGSNGLKLKSHQPQDAVVPSTPAEEQDDFEWAEGSLGVRFGGTKRDNRARSSSISAMSPSMGSCMTLESEDDAMDGLCLPDGEFDFAARLKKRQVSVPEEPDSSPTPAPRLPVKEAPDQALSPGKQGRDRKQFDDDDDFMEGIDVGPGEIFDPKKRAFNRNVQVQSNKTHIPSPRTATTLTFTDKPGASRIPRPTGALAKNSKHDPASRLDPVYEPGAAQKSRQNRPAPTTTNSQLLRAKRSAPVLGSNFRSTPKQSHQSTGPSSAQSHHLKTKSSQGHLRSNPDAHRAQSPALRSHSRLGGPPPPDTPSRTAARKNVTLAAPPTRETHIKTRLTGKKRTFGDGSELEVFDDLPTSATKESKYIKTPALRTAGSAKALSGAASQQQLRHQQSASRLTIPDRNITPLPPPTPRTLTKMDATPRFAQDTYATRMARQQRLAEQSSGTGSSRPKSGGPLMPVSTNWKAQVAASSPYGSPTATKRKKGTGQKPTLIKSMGQVVTKNEKGMTYNPTLQRWEGNESALSRFTTPTPTASNPHLPLQSSHAHPYSNRQQHHHNHTNSTPNLRRPSNTTLNAGSPPRPTPALISNMGGRAVQVERGMVFDPQRMCWLKLDSGVKRQRRKSRDLYLMNVDWEGARRPDTEMDEDDAEDDDDDDPFKGLEDLKDETDHHSSRPSTAVRNPPAGGGSRPASGFFGSPLANLTAATAAPTPGPNPNPTSPAAFVDEPPPVCEEFDLGPEFIRRQREEEAIWTRRVGPWTVGRDAVGEDWRWRIREIGRAAEGTKGVGLW